MLIDKIATELLGLIKNLQNGRVAENATAVTFDFSEYWFRTSGLYDLCDKYQLQLISAFIADKFNWNKAKVQKEAAKCKQWQEFIEKAKKLLVDQKDLLLTIQLIENDTFKTEEQLIQKTKDLNGKAKNKLINGDATTELEKLPDGCIDAVITDPPYGIDYESNYSKYNDYVTKIGISNDGHKEAMELLNKTCEILTRKTKENAHVYIFTSWKVYPEFKAIIEKYFTVKNLIVWDKGNASMGDLEGSWGNQHEMIIFATKGNRKLNKRKFDLLSVPRVPTIKAVHPTQKPEALIRELLEASSQPADTICDPFMGSGSTIKAIKEHDKSLNYIGIELDEERFEKAKAYIGGDV
jgi:site-specific DNA-methyltransferase (adenine-specific)